MQKLTRRIIITGSALLLAILLFAALILPGIVRNALVKNLESFTGRKTEIRKVSINPLTLTAAVHGFRLAEKGSAAPFASFSSARVSVSPASLFRQALIVSEVELRSPHLNLVRTAENRYNFSDLLESKKPKKTGEKPPLFSINNIVVNNGSMDFLDEAITDATRHTVRKLDLAVPFVSNIPYLADRYVTPKLSAVINGTSFSATGKLKPMSSSMETSASLSLKQLDIPYYLGYLPKSIPLKVSNGKFSTELEIIYMVSAANKPDLTLKGSIILDDLSIAERNGAPLLALKQGALDISQAAIFTRSFHLSKFTLEAPELFIERDPSGVLNFQRLLPQPEKSQPQPEKTADVAAGQKLSGPPPVKGQPPKEPDVAQKRSPKPTLSLDSIRIADGKFHLTDRKAPSGTFATTIERFAFDMQGLSTLPGKKGSWRSSLRTSHAETLETEGTVVVEPLDIAATVKLAGVKLGDYATYSSQFLTAPVNGVVDAACSVYYTPQTGPKATDFTLTAKDIRARFTDEDYAKVNLCSLAGGEFNLQERHGQLERFDLKGADLKISREPDGSLSPLKLLRPRKKSDAEPPPKSQKGASTKPFSLKLSTAAISGLNASFTDKTREDPPTFKLKGVQATATGIASPQRTPIGFAFNATYDGGGPIKARGTVAPSPLNLIGTVEIRRIPLRDFTPYLPENINLFIAEGNIDSTLKLNVASRSSGMTGTVAGSVGIRSFYSLDTVEDEDFLKWESLQLDEISCSLQPLALTISQVALNNLYARLVINKDGTLNLNNIFPSQKKGGAKPDSSTNPTPENKGSLQQPPAPAAAKRQIRVDTITVQDGTLAFTDHHLPQEFDTTFHNLGGRVAGISTDETRMAEVDLRGNLENHSPLSITGTLNPLWSDPFVDLKVSFTDIDLSPFTPYSGTYLGYTVDKGKLFLDLKYRIEKKSLTSENKVFIDQFTFGDAVKSEKATSLPVRLAIALLKDRKGEIHLDLPVTGRTDDPKFSIWGVVGQMLKNLLVKVATSPFSLLSSLFGGGEDFSVISFPTGSARLTPAESGKLSNMAKALLDRPELKLEISGFVDRERDAEGYRKEQLLRKLKTEKFLAMTRAKQTQPGQTPETIDLLPQDEATYLKTVYGKEKFPKPRNVLGFVKDIPDPEMKKLILANTAAGDEQLHALARERENAVRDYLITKGNLPAGRLFLKTGEIYKPSGKEGVGNARVEFGAGVP